MECGQKTYTIDSLLLMYPEASFLFKIDARATGWGLRLRFERNENSKGKRFRFKKAKLEKGSVQQTSVSQHMS